MDGLRWALTWLVVLAVGLAPMLVYWAAGVIGRAFRRKRGGSPTGSAPSTLREAEGGFAGVILSQWPGRARPGSGAGGPAHRGDQLGKAAKGKVGPGRHCWC